MSTPRAGAASPTTRQRLREAWRHWLAPIWDDPRVLASALQRAYYVWRAGGFAAISEWRQWKLHLTTPSVPAAQWWARYQRGAWRRHWRRWRRAASGPRFTIVLAPELEQVSWWRAAIDSVQAQEYPCWELLILTPSDTTEATSAWLQRIADRDSRVRVLPAKGPASQAERFNAGLRASTGEYVAFLDEADALEPEALGRWASAAGESMGLLSSDEIVTTHDLNSVAEVRALPAFSYDYLLSTDYFPSVWAARRELLLAVHGFHDQADRYDLLLRLCERADGAGHAPGVASRRRSYPGRPKRRADAPVVARHLARIGSSAAIQAPAGLPLDVVYPAAPKARVAAVIPTRDRADLLSVCVRTLEPLVAAGDLDVVIVDHESTEPETLRLLERLAAEHTVIGYRGIFNFSAMMNHAVAAVGGRYSHFLFLNNDIEALDARWLPHMLGLASREEVGIVGATLLYPDRRVQHAGVVTGLCGAAAHTHVLEPFADASGARRGGYLDTLAATRDVNAVTGACLVVRAEVLAKLNGFDERLRVGFGDVDLCLRARAAGYQVLVDAQAVLVHHESVTRGKRFWGSHPDDSLYFAARYFRGAAADDPFYNPLLSPVTARYVLNRSARHYHSHAPRRQRVRLPEPAPALWSRTDLGREAA